MKRVLSQGLLDEVQLLHNVLLLLLEQLQNSHDVANVFVGFLLGLGKLRLDHVEKSLRVVFQVANPRLQLGFLQKLGLDLC